MLRIGLVVPHIFLHQEILPHVIFSPGTLALDLVEGLQAQGAEVTLFSPGPVQTSVTNITADLSYFEQELQGRDDTYLSLLKKHSFTFVTMARQIQAELIAKAYTMANADEFDVIHIYTNEEELALPFAALCRKPVVFTHHDPFNFLVKYKNNFPKYTHLNWLSMSYAQRQGMPADTNWVANIYHGIPETDYTFSPAPQGEYVAFLGRIIEPKGVHLAIKAVQEYNHTATHPLTLKIAGKHYSGAKDDYWQNEILPLLDDPSISYVGFLKDPKEKQEFLGNAQALLVPSLFDEPFGMVMIEALACGTPLVGINSGAISEVISAKTGFVVERSSEEHMVAQLADALKKVGTINRQDCRREFEERFTLTRMSRDHMVAYRQLVSDRV